MVHTRKKEAPLQRRILQAQAKVGGISGAHARANATTRIAPGGGRWGNGKIPKPRTHIESTATRRQAEADYLAIIVPWKNGKMGKKGENGAAGPW